MKQKLILGTVQFGQRYGIYKKKIIKEKEINKIFKYAFKNNIIFLDTATSYGKSNLYIKNFNNKKKKI